MNGYSELLERIQSRRAFIVVFGLGYVGLPLAVSIAHAGFEVIGVDRNEARVDHINKGENYIEDVKDDDLRNVVRDGKMKATTEFEEAHNADILIICVPTPLDRNKNPDTTFIENVVTKAQPHLKPNQLMILESTTFPGTTEETIQPRIESQGFTLGENFHLAYSPERVDPGSQSFNVSAISKVVGGITSNCTEIAKAFYETFISGGVSGVSSPRVAEMSKLLENVFRVVNVSLINELATLCERMGINVWEVVDAAKTKPFGFMPFYPSPGVGGHCIPIDPFFLAWKAQEYDFSTRFIRVAGEINDRMPEYVVDRITDVLNRHKQCLNGAKVLLVGMSYKQDTNDLRHAPAVKVASLLKQREADAFYHDPYVPCCQVNGETLYSTLLERDTLNESNIVVITTDHSGIDYELIADHAPLVYDTRNALKDYRDRPHVFQLGGVGPYSHG